MNQIKPIEIPNASLEPDAYRDALLAVIGDRDPLDVIAETPKRICALLEGREARELERQPAAGEWSAAEIIGHLVDVEMVTSFRCRLILTAEQPSYPGYDEKLWSELPKPPIDQLWPVWEALRSYNLWLFRSVPRSELSRTGVHSEAGLESVELILSKYAGHDLAHLNQLERSLAG